MRQAASNGTIEPITHPQLLLSARFEQQSFSAKNGGTSLLDTLKESGRKAEQSTFNGTRKLVRPHLPQPERRHDGVHADDPMSHAMGDGASIPESSHAEAFYFQKQMQQQTEMTVVLEDGEEIHGTVQWFDRCVIKLRSGRKRVLIYKSAIKYLFKRSEAALGAPVMK